MVVLLQMSSLRPVAQTQPAYDSYIKSESPQRSWTFEETQLNLNARQVIFNQLAQSQNKRLGSTAIPDEHTLKFERDNMEALQRQAIETWAAKQFTKHDRPKSFSFFKNFKLF